MEIYLLGVLLLGLFVGLVSGMFGLGGGGLIVPVLLPLLPLIGVSDSSLMFMAMGTAFATMIISTGASAYNQFKNQNIDFQRIKLFLPLLLLTVLLTSQFVTAIDPNILKLAFSSFLIYLGSKMLIQKKKTAPKLVQPSRQTGKDLLYAVLIGIISTLGSISGAGLIITYLNAAGMNLKKAIGTASFCGVFLTISASIGFMISGFGQSNLPPYSLGFIHLPTVLLIALASIPMTKVGVKLMLKLSDQRIKVYFALFLITLSVYMIISTVLSF